MSTLVLVMPIAALGYALIGGVLLAFSDFIMRSLARTPGTGGIEAMQTINREVFRWTFMGLFLGMTAASVGLAVHAALQTREPASALILSAALVYVLGCFGVTVGVNVPLNRRLAGMDAADPATRRFWSATYLPRWTRWNTVRALACVLAAALMLSGFSRV